MEDSTHGLKPPKRMRTGEFDEPFAREANKRRQQRQPIRLVPRLRSTVSSQKTQHRAWYRRMSAKFMDAENPDSHKGLYRRPPIESLLDIQVPCRRAPFGSRSPLLFLTTREDPSSPETGNLRWLHIQHTGIRFEKFVDRATENATVPSTTKGAIKDWLSGLQSQLETSVFAGMAFPCTVKGSMFAAESEEDNEHTVNDTCLFLTLPYFLLSEGRFPHKGGQSHPVRALVENLYRNESPFSREFFQAVNRLERSVTGKVIYVPQIWCLLINDEYIATCAPTQLHTRPTSYIATVPGSEYPASVRLCLRWGLKFCIKLEECKAWFDFMLKVHHIYSQVLGMHVDVEHCTYLRGSLKINADGWKLIVRNYNFPGALIDIKILLPNENNRWGSSVKRKIQQEYMDTSGHALNKVSRFDVDPESLEAFDVIHSNSYYATYDEIELDGSISLALVDKIRDHAETRKELEDDAGRSDERGEFAGRRRRSVSRQVSVSDDDSEDENEFGRRVIFESESDYSSASPRGRRNPSRQRLYLDKIGDYREEQLLIPHCYWPGCYRKFKRLGPKVIRETVFWAPPKVTQARPAEAGKDESPGYLVWPIYSKAKDGFQLPPKAREKDGRTRAFRRHRGLDPPSDMDSSQNSGDRAGPVVIDNSPMAHLHKSLSEIRLYRKQEPASTSKLGDLISQLLSTRYMDLAALATDARDLIEHFIPLGVYSQVKETAFGALYDILKTCEKFDQDALKRHAIDRASKEMERALFVSQSIRQGVYGRQGDVFLLKSLVNALKSLVLWLVEFNSGLPRPQKVTNPDRETTPNATGAVVAYSDTMARDAQSRRAVQPPDKLEMESGTKIYSDRPVSGRNPRERRRDWKRASLAKLKEVTRKLESAKIELLELFESQKPLDLELYSTVNTSGIIASVITSLAHGDCDLPLPLNPENAYLSSMLRTSACGASDSVVHLNLEGLYQEYCSKLRLTVRDNPTRNLLDDLDLAEEELDSIISVTESQQRVIKDFKSQSPHRLPTQNAWVGELDTVHRMLENKIGVYKDLKVQINKLRKHVTLQVQVKQDNNSKAVLVFTTVTVIFLPLSFVTSYFGMNTSDIRDVAIGQWIFWAISAPLTVFVVGFCMTVAYQGHKIQEYFRRL